MSRAELVQIATELDLDWHSKSIRELKAMIRKEVDKRFDKRFHVSPNAVSKTLLKFMTQHYNYKLVDQKGKEV